MVKSLGIDGMGNSVVGVVAVGTVVENRGREVAVVSSGGDVGGVVVSGGAVV